jgi:hypothetical protein
VNELFRDTGRAKLPSVLNYLKENLLEVDVVPKFVSRKRWEEAERRLGGGWKEAGRRLEGG